MQGLRFIPMSAADACRFRQSANDDYGHSIRRMKSDGAYPCRHCLAETPRGQDVLLLSYKTPFPGGVYGHPTAIFLCAEECAPLADSGNLPDIVANRAVVLRAFGPDGAMAYEANVLVPDNGDPLVEILRVFREHDVRQINLHTLKAGCFLCAVVPG